MSRNNFFYSRCSIEVRTRPGINFTVKNVDLFVAKIMFSVRTFAKSTVAQTFALFSPIETVVSASCPLIQSGSIRAG